MKNICNGWTAEEDALLETELKKWGNRWKAIAKAFPDRSEASLRNRHARLSKSYPTRRYRHKPPKPPKPPKSPKSPKQSGPVIFQSPAFVLAPSAAPPLAAALKLVSDGFSLTPVREHLSPPRVGPVPSLDLNALNLSDLAVDNVDDCIDTYYN